MKTLQFREWVSSPEVPLGAPERDALRTQFRAVVQPSPGVDGCYDVTPENIVGAVVVSNTQIVVEPKVPIQHLLFLLGYTADPLTWRHELPRLVEVPDVVSAMASLYVTLCEDSTRRGLLRGYYAVDADVATVRGRIDVAQQLRRRPGLDLPLAVHFAEYDEDIAENQLLLAAARLFRALPLRHATVRRSLHRLVDTLQNVTPVHYRRAEVPVVSWHRLNEHYRPAVELARLLLRQRSVDVAPGGVSGAGLTINMAELFEDFVRTALAEELRVGAAEFPSGDAVRGLSLDAAGRIRLEPDLSHWHGSTCTFVGDVKYKRDTGRGRSADLYQLLAYATATRLPEATLVYAQGPPEPRLHDIRGIGVRLRVEHLDLALPPARLLEQLGNLARYIEDRRGAVPATDAASASASASASAWARRWSPAPAGGSP